LLLSGFDYAFYRGIDYIQVSVIADGMFFFLFFFPNPLPSTHLPCNSGCDSDLDLAFLLDGSGSVTAQGFQQAKGMP
jgi:hypothetical protein